MPFRRFHNNNNKNIHKNIHNHILHRLTGSFGLETMKAAARDIVSVKLELTPENGYVPESLFDTRGDVSFVLGWGNYLPGLHDLVTGMSQGSTVENVSIDGGWGERNENMIIEVPKTNFKKIKSIDSIQEGSVLNLKGDGKVQVLVVKVTEDTIVVDANPPLAGSSYSCSLTVTGVCRFPSSKLQYHQPSKEIVEESPLEVATWAMGCFWGGELAFMRVPGVVGTRVGYTQGLKKDPTYEEVCQGDTKHREAIMVVYDPRVVTYEELLKTFLERLRITIAQYKINLFEVEDESNQYQHGIYYHNDEQKVLAQDAIAINNNAFNVELKQATVFYDAEEYHQQYLLKGGQSARKGAKETIRCYG